MVMDPRIFSPIPATRMEPGNLESPVVRGPLPTFGAPQLTGQTGVMADLATRLGQGDEEAINTMAAAGVGPGAISPNPPAETAAKKKGLFDSLRGVQAPKAPAVSLNKASAGNQPAPTPSIPAAAASSAQVGLQRPQQMRTLGGYLGGR